MFKLAHTSYEKPSGQSGTILSLFFTVMYMEVTIELLREASTRLSGPLGQTIGVVGGLVLGTAAVQANLVSPAMVIVVSITAISTFIGRYRYIKHQGIV